MMTFKCEKSGIAWIDNTGKRQDVSVMFNKKFNHNVIKLNLYSL